MLFSLRACAEKTRPRRDCERGLYSTRIRSHPMTKRHAIVIGGGASGVLFAYQLLRRGSAAFRVTLIERRSEIGRGLAYHTGNPDHLLNVRAGNMSALPEDP